MLFYWDGSPIALELGFIQLRWYGIFFSFGFILGYLLVRHFFKQKAYTLEALDKLLVYLFVGTLIGARLGHCLIYDPQFYLSNPLEILKIWHGGLASHGGAIGLVLAFYLFNRKYHKQYNYDTLCVIDMLTIPTAMVATLIRLGNFMNSEILGKYTNADYGVVFLRTGDLLPRHPAQLYEAFCYFIIFIALYCIYRFVKNLPKGMLLGILITSVFICRFFIEFVKEEQASYHLGVEFTVGQYLSIPFIIIGIILCIYFYKRAKNKV